MCIRDRTEGYLLEVASPGAERPLRKAEHFAGAVGEYIFVKLYQKINNDKEITVDLAVSYTHLDVYKRQQQQS